MDTVPEPYRQPGRYTGETTMLVLVQNHKSVILMTEMDPF